MRYMQPFGLQTFRGLEAAQQRIGTARTVLVKDNDVESAFRVLNRCLNRRARGTGRKLVTLRLMSAEGLLGVIRRTARFEKPFKQRQRAAFSACRAIYDEDMGRKIAFLSRLNRKDPNPGLH